MNEGVYIGMPKNSESIKFSEFKENNEANAVITGKAGRGMGFYINKSFSKNCNSQSFAFVDPESEYQKAPK